MAQTKPSRAIKLFGTEVPEGKRRELSAGPITAMLDNGALRYIRYRGVEVLRAIAYIVRDKNWGTYAPAIVDLKVKQGKDGFTVSYGATCRDADQAIRYHARIEANSDGTLTFSADGTPESDFLTNRTGFVVLHPLEGVVGKPVDVVHVEGKREKRTFPKLISPGQPIFEVRSLKHTVMSGVTATVFMEGNKFEMEDHRNWMDASYKTYVCSLLDPWPYTLPAGQMFAQSVNLSIAGKPSRALAKRSRNVVQVALGRVSNPLPALGMGVPMKEAEAALAKANIISAASPSHLVCQIDGRETGQVAAARAFRALKEKTNLPIVLEIILPAKQPADREVSEIAAALREGGLKPDSLVITQAHDLKSFQPNSPRPPGPTYEEMAAAVRSAFPGVPLGGGMLSYFTELNRKRPPQGLFEFITHTVCPIVHAADDISVMETLESLPSIFASARAIIGKSPYHLGPSSIPCRDNPYGAAVAPNPDNGRVCLSNLDPRQRGLFAAAWNLGLFAAAARGKLDAIALGSATGSQGVISSSGIHPAYHVLAGLGRAGRVKTIETASSVPGKIAALAHQSKSGPVLWLANLTAEKQTAKVSGFSGGAGVHMLDENSFGALTSDSGYLAKKGKSVKKVSGIELGAYAVSRIAAS